MKSNFPGKMLEKTLQLKHLGPKKERKLPFDLRLIVRRHFSSVQSLRRVRPWDRMDGHTPGLPVHSRVPECTQYGRNCFWWCFFFSPEWVQSLALDQFQTTGIPITRFQSQFFHRNLKYELQQSPNGLSQAIKQSTAELKTALTYSSKEFRRVSNNNQWLKK